MQSVSRNAAVLVLRAKTLLESRLPLLAAERMWLLHTEGFSAAALELTQNTDCTRLLHTTERFVRADGSTQARAAAARSWRQRRSRGAMAREVRARARAAVRQRTRAAAVLCSSCPQTEQT